MRVLVVDNSSAVRQRLLDLIRESNGVERVWQAADASSALALVRDERMDVAIVDLSLGRGSGLDLLQELRAVDASLVLIVLTNSSADIYREACLRRGAQFFFDKSRDFERAVAVIGQVTGSAGARV